MKIAIIGHSPDTFSNHSSIKYDVDNAVSILKRQYVEERPIFLVHAEPGVGQWACDGLVEHKLSYEVYLAAMPSDIGIHWQEEQKDKFNLFLNTAAEVHITDICDTASVRSKRNNKMIDDAQWVLCFWNGKHQGLTYDAINYAIKSNKIVYNGIGGLHVLDNKGLG